MDCLRNGNEEMTCLGKNGFESCLVPEMGMKKYLVFTEEWVRIISCIRNGNEEIFGV